MRMLSIIQEIVSFEKLIYEFCPVCTLNACSVCMCFYGKKVGQACDFYFDIAIESTKNPFFLNRYRCRCHCHYFIFKVFWIEVFERNIEEEKTNLRISLTEPLLFTKHTNRTEKWKSQYIPSIFFFSIIYCGALSLALFLCYSLYILCVI